MVKQISTMLLSFFIALALFIPESADAANCQGLSRGKCKSSSNCVWVSGYKRKGTQVKAYCRAKPTRSAVKRKTIKKRKVSKKRRVKKKKTTQKKKRVVKKRKTSKKKKVVKKRRVTKKKAKTKKRTRRKKKAE